MILGLVVFLSDAVLEALAGEERRAWLAGEWHAVIWAGFIALIIAVNGVAFIEGKWAMVVPSVSGVMVGSAWSVWRRRHA